MYAAHRQVLAPSAVSHAVSLSFTAAVPELAVVTSSILHIYAVAPSHSEIPGARLHLKHSFHLSGVIESIAKVAIQAGRHALLLAFADAKISLVEYSPLTCSLVTVSIHCYEREEFKRDAQMIKEPPTIRVDPQSRVAVTRFYNGYFAILPFSEPKDVVGLDGSSNHCYSFLYIAKGCVVVGCIEKTNSSHQPFLPSFVIKHTDIFHDVKDLIDFCFLFGYLEPTLAILFQPHQIWTGRLGSKKDTVSIMIVSLDVTQNKYPVLYRVDGLPYNCTKLQPIPKPLGGLLVVSDNALIYMDQATTPGIACLFNSYFDHEVLLKSMPSTEEEPLPPVKPKAKSIYYTLGQISDYKHLGISLDGCNMTFISPDIIILLLRTGEMVQIDLVGDDGIGRSWKRRRAGIKKFQVKVLGLRMMRTTAIVQIAGPSTTGIWEDNNGFKFKYGYFFASSRVADCMLVQHFECIETGKMFEIEVDGDDELDTELYGGSKTLMDTSADVPPMRYRVCDTLFVAGPIRDFSLGKPARYSTHPYQGDSADQNLEVVACTGEGKDGSITVLHNSVLPQILSSFELADVNDIWSVKVKSEEEYHKFIVLSRESATSV